MNTKEKLAVDEWINSKKKLHIMHDHVKHDQCVILAGMFGIKGKLFDDTKQEILNYIKNKNYDFKKRVQLDQLFLKDVVWKLCENNYISHGNTPGCFKKFGLISKKFPGKKYDFIYDNLSFIGQRNI